MTLPIASTTAAGPGVGAAAGAAPVDPQIAEAARGFEGIFMSMLIDEMMAGTSLGATNPMYVGLVTEKLGDALADAGGIGLAAVLERQLGGMS
jgi:peptidoglycan hydrolase FlgJ